MGNAEELKAITRKVLGDGPGPDFYARADHMLDEALTNTALLAATKEIEMTVKFFIDVEAAGILRRKYKEFFSKHTTYV